MTRMNSNGLNGRGDTAASRRVDWVDTAKGFCIILVVMMHSTLGVEDAAGAESWLGAVVAWAEPFRIPAFFVTAALFLSRSIESPWRDFLDRKLVHFAYFYVLWVTIQFVFKAPGIAADVGAMAALYYYAESFIQPFGTLWFIYILPIFFIVTRLVRNAPVWLVLALAALLQLLPIHTGWVAVDEFASRFVFFYAGYALAHHAFAIADYARTHRSEMLLGLTIWLIIQTLYVYTSLAWQPGFALLLGAFGAAAVVTLSSLIADKKWAQVISYCGQNSLVIYLAFFLPMALSRVVLLKFGIISDVGTIAALVTTTAIICPLIGYWVIRRIGFGGFLFNRPFWARLTAAEKPAVHSIAA